MFEYLFARHRDIYIKIAYHYFTSPKHVWSLAHGKPAKTDKDSKILHELLDYGIIHRYHHSKNPDDYKMD